MHALLSGSQSEAHACGRHGGPDGERALNALVELCGRPLPVVNGVKHTELWASSKGVDEVNTHELRALPSELVCACSSAACRLLCGHHCSSVSHIPTSTSLMVLPLFVGVLLLCVMSGARDGMQGAWHAGSHRVLCMSAGDIGRIRPP